MNRDEVLDIVRSKAVELLDVDATAVTEDASLVADLDVDSLALVEYVMALEDSFGIALPEEDLGDVKSVGQIVDLVLEKISTPA